MSEWISVKDRLPEEGMFVLGTDGKKVYFWKSQVTDELLNLFPISITDEVKTTYWMPLPNPPKENNIDEKFSN